MASGPGFVRTVGERLVSGAFQGMKKVFAQPERLSAYDAELGRTLGRLTPILAESGMVLEGSLTAIANTAATIAQAKLTLSDLDRAALQREAKQRLRETRA